ncbi:MAG: AlbA family DNA-binding domain-containing protein [Patescibacteria group bacterium]
MSKINLKKALLVFITLLILSGGAFFFTNYFFGYEEVSLTDLSNKINQEEVEEIDIMGESVTVTLKDGEKIKSNKEPEGTFSETIINYGANKENLANVDVTQKDEVDYNSWIVFSTIAVLLLLSGFFIFRRLGLPVYIWKVKDKILGRTEEKNKNGSKKNYLKLLNREESKTLEFKSSLRWDYRQDKVNKDLEKVIAKTVAAFLNTEGGILFIGVDDNGEALGLEKDLGSFNGSRDGFLKKLSEIINKYLGPDNHALITPRFLEKDQKDICVLRVDRSNRPVYLKNGQENKFYIRTQNSSMEITGAEADQYKEKRFR